MIKLLVSTHRVIHVATYPVTYVAEKLHVKRIVRSKRSAKICIGIGLTLTGSSMALYPISAVPHVLWDALAYTLHGYGALPMIKLACEKLNLESLDDNSDEEIKLLEEKIAKIQKHQKENRFYDI